MSDSPTIWVLADDRAGNRAQCLGVANRLGDHEVKEIRYTGLVKLPNVLRGSTLIGVDGKSKATLQAPWPDVVISAGRRTAPIARFIKRKNPTTKLVHLMWPDAGANQFDCIVLPSHDREHKDVPNVLRVLGAPHRATPANMQMAAEGWAPRFKGLEEPRIAVLIGGTSKHGKFTKSDFEELGELAASMLKAERGTALVTTSRRTGVGGEKMLRKYLKPFEHYMHSYNAKEKEENPYMGFLGLADAFIVTADSIAMCSEACATGKPVYIFSPKNLSAKHARFANTLIATGYAYPLEDDFTQGLKNPMKKEPLDSALTIAKHIRDELLG